MAIKPVFLLCVFILTISCERVPVELDKEDLDTGPAPSQSTPVIDSAPVSSDLTPGVYLKDVESTISLSYTDADSDQATSCSVSGLSNLTETTSCACSLGTCSVGVTGTSGYIGAVSFNYTVTANGATSNSSSVNFTLITLGASTSDEWIRVPANAGGAGLSAFFVMKYEPRAWNDGDSDSIIDAGEIATSGHSINASTHVPVSIADHTSWGDILAGDAAAECESLGANYHLISNNEWMAIARDVENIDANWTGQSVGVGCLYRGNSWTETTVGTGTSSGDSCGYMLGGGGYDSGVGRDIRAKHLLSNGQEIFDFAGNKYEWVDWDGFTTGFQTFPTTCTGTNVELPSVSCGAISDVEYNSENGSYTSTDGVGVFNGGVGAAAARRGAGTAANSGVFTLNLLFGTADVGDGTGFRCVFRP